MRLSRCSRRLWAPTGEGAREPGESAFTDALIPAASESFNDDLEALAHVPLGTPVVIHDSPRADPPLARGGERVEDDLGDGEGDGAVDGESDEGQVRSTLLASVDEVELTLP